MDKSFSVKPYSPENIASFGEAMKKFVENTILRV